jgi:hypothetical protein
VDEYDNYGLSFDGQGKPTAPPAGNKKKRSHYEQSGQQQAFGASVEENGMNVIRAKASEFMPNAGSYGPSSPSKGSFVGLGTGGGIWGGGATGGRGGGWGTGN